MLGPNCDAGDERVFWYLYDSTVANKIFSLFSQMVKIIEKDF